MNKTKIGSCLLAIFLAVIMVFGLLPITVSARGYYSYENTNYEESVPEIMQGAHSITSPAALTVATFSDVAVIVSFEGYNLGHGFFIEPTEVIVPYGSSAMDATIFLLNERGYTYDLSTWNGLDRIHGFNLGEITVSPYISLELLSGSEDGSLGSFDYSPYSGWMVTVDHSMLPVGASDWEVSSGEVIRWQFSVEGWGADLGLGMNNGFWNDPPYIHSDKTDLIRGLFQQGITYAARQAALSVIIDPLSTSTEVSAVHEKLLIGQAPQEANKTVLISTVTKAEVLQQQDYTLASWLSFQRALSSAQAVSENIFATQEAVDRAVSRLQSAIVSLETTVAIEWQTAMNGALGWLSANSPNPSIGDEWAVLAIARANIAADVWFKDYLLNLENEIANLTTWTDFQRVTLALTALGEDASDFGGNDLLSDFRNFTPLLNRQPQNQGINADIFTLIALNSRPYTGAQMQYVESILAAQTPSGAWAWGDWASADITAMAIQSLAPYYYNNTAVITAVNNGFEWIETQALESAEDYAQIIIALTAVGYSADKYVEGLLSFYDETSSGFISPWTGTVNAISTEQAAYALVAHYRHVNGMNSLFDMRDAGEGIVTPPPQPPSPQPPSSPQSQPPPRKVFISVRNDNPINGGTKLFYEGYLNINPNETAYSLLLRTGLVVATRGTYVYSIENLAEFDFGAGSGWLYKVNGDFPVLAASDFALRDNDRVEWLYTRNLGKDVGNSQSSPKPPSLSAVNYDVDDESTNISEEETFDILEENEESSITETENTEAENGYISEIPEENEVWENPFTDVLSTDWFYPHARFMYNRGLMTGVAQGIFAPDTNLSRAMAVNILWRLEYKPMAHSGTDFDDVTYGQWYTDSIAWAHSVGIVQGFGDDTFRPNAPITREHFAAILRNYAIFSDTTIDLGVLGSLTGNGTISRAEAAAILQAFIEN